MMDFSPKRQREGLFWKGEGRLHVYKCWKIGCGAYS